MKKLILIIHCFCITYCYGQSGAKKYDYQAKYSEGLAMVYILTNTGYKYGFIDKTGKEVVPLKYEAASDLHEGLARVKLNGKCGFIDKTGKVVIPMKYDDAGNFEDGKVRVEKDGFRFYIDRAGKEVSN